MAFLDDDELDTAPRGRGPRPPRRGAGGDQRDILVRRVVALGAGVLVLVLVLFGIRGCLDARKERGFENYASDLSSIVTQANQLSLSFFERLQTPPTKSSPLNLEAEIAADRGTAQGLLNRVEELDTPDELDGAQDELVKAFELRRDALTGIADQIPTALGDQGRTEAIDAIASDMRSLLAGDVLYARAKGEIEQVLSEEQIEAAVEDSIFLPEPLTRWLDTDELSLILSSFAADAGAAPGVHGLELVSAKVAKTPLIAGSENTVDLSSPVEISAEVSNGGDSREVDVAVKAEISGPTGVIEGQTTISRIDPGEVGTALIQLEQDPPTGTPLTVEVKALPVPGEELFDNNTLTYTVTFE